MFAVYHPCSLVITFGVLSSGHIGAGVIFRFERKERSFWSAGKLLSHLRLRVYSVARTVAVRNTLSLAQQLGTDQNRPSPLKLATLRRSALSTTASRAAGPYRVRVRVGVRVI